MKIWNDLFRQVAEGAPLLREYVLIAHQGFESLLFPPPHYERKLLI